MSQKNAARTPISAPWLFGPIPDLMLGCGLLYVVLFAAFLVAGPEIRNAQAHYIFPALILLFSGPHYGATLLRVYEQRAERQRYAIFAVYATALVVVAFVGSLYNAVLASWMATLYLTWSPWHYTGQNYGIGVMFLRRRGVDVTAVLKRFLYASFVVSYALTFLMVHVGGSKLAVVPEIGSSARFVPLGIPRGIVDPLLVLLGIAYVAVLAGFTHVLIRQRAWRHAGPTAVLMLTQALWFPVPLAFQHFGWLKSVEPFDIDLRGHYALWIALGHAVQYLWVTAYYARAAAEWGGYWSYFAKVLAAGTAIWTLPYLVFGRGTLGPLSVDAGLLMLVAAAINIHHFILDGAIWKLRNMRIASVLLRPTTATSAAAAGGGPIAPSWGRRLVWHTAIAGLAVGVFAFWQENVGYLSAFMRGDFARASAVLDQLGWVGKESSTARIAVAMQLLRRGDLDGARQQAARSIALRETTDGYVLTGMIEERAQDTREALAAYQHALAIDPNRRDALIRAGMLQQALGESAQAQALLDRAASLSAQQQQPDRGPDRY